MNRSDSPAPNASGTRYRTPAMPLELNAGTGLPSLSMAVKAVQRRLGMPQDGHLSPSVAMEFRRLAVGSGLADVTD